MRQAKALQRLLRPDTRKAAKSLGNLGLCNFNGISCWLLFVRFVDVTVYCWKHNIRASPVMGMIGEGGMGAKLIISLRQIDYPYVSATLVVTLGTAIVVDELSNWPRVRSRQ